MLCVVESVADESVLLVEDDGVEEVSLDATVPEALAEVDALPLNEPDAELVASLEVELLLAMLESVEVRPVGERASSDDVAPALIDPESEVDEVLAELGVWLASVSELLVAVESLLTVALLLIEVLLFSIDVVCEELLDGCEDVVSALPDEAVAPFNPNAPEVVAVLAEFVVSELATFALLVFAAVALESLIVAF